KVVPFRAAVPGEIVADDAGHQEFLYESLATFFETLFDEQWQECNMAFIGFRQKILRVQVAQRCKYLQHALVKLHARIDVQWWPLSRSVGFIDSFLPVRFQPKLQQLESLNRIDGMHRPLQRQMHVIHFQQQNSLIDNSQSFASRQFAPALDSAKEFRERFDANHLCDLLNRPSLACFSVRQCVNPSERSHKYYQRYANTARGSTWLLSARSWRYFLDAFFLAALPFFFLGPALPPGSSCVPLSWRSSVLGNVMVGFSF